MKKLLSSADLNKIVELRRTIHSNPELAHEEFATANTIMKFLGNEPDEIITGLGGTGIAFIYKGKKKVKLFCSVRIWMPCRLKKLIFSHINH